MIPRSNRTHLFLRHGVIHQDEVRQPRKFAQNVEIRELGDLIRGQDEVAQVRHRVGCVGLYGGDAVAREEEGGYPRGQGEVAEHGDIVVGEVDRIERLSASHACSVELPRGKETHNQRRGRGDCKEELTPATPRFSMAGIRWPVQIPAKDEHAINSAPNAT